MCDEIDIEEHDILDNPTIKNIFPDITVIKKEITAYYTEVSDVNQESQENVIDKETKLANLTDSKIKSDITNSKQENHTTTLIQTENQCNNKSPVNLTSTDFNNKPNFLHCNKIILGSNKTKNNECHNTPETNLQAKVLVKNIGPYLNKCKRYCDKCLVLFPNIYAMNIHRKNFHLQMNRFKNSNKNVLSKNYVSKIQCKVCGANFSASGNLYRHYRNIHNISNIDTVHNINKVQSQDMKKQDGSYKPCSHCHKTFLTQQSLIEHLYDVLQKPNRDLQKNEENNLALENNEFIENDHKRDKISKKTDKFTETYEHEETTKSDLKKSHKMYRCSICGYYFFTKKYYLSHMTNKHRVLKQIKNNKVVFESKCKLCSCTYSNVKSFNVHIHKCHKKELTQMFKFKQQKQLQNPMENKNKLVSQVNRDDISKKSELETLTTNMIITQQPGTGLDVFILKTTLFKCIKCDIHFLFSKVAMDHLTHIEMLINWKCNICKKIFKKDDEPLHMKQHYYSDIFTIYDVGESIVSMVLYHCPKCAVHFGEDNFIRHYLKCGFETPNSAYCKVCDILIDDALKIVHDQTHKHENFKPTDFIIIKSDIDLNDMPKMVNNQRVKIRKLTATIRKPFQKTNRHCYTYCKTCKCFLNYPYKFAFHRQSHCTHIVKKVCKYCGLLFTLKSAILHKRLHQKRKLKLQDFVFCDSSGKQIDPPIPDYPHCNECKVHFISKIARNTHECREEDYVTCHICKIKLSEAAYKLHMTFHNYSSKKFSNNTPSNTNVNLVKLQNMAMEISPKNEISLSEYYQCDILYSCRNCNITVDTYDKVIIHCQGHYNPEEKLLNTKVCKYCSLKFDSTCYENHQKFHANENNVQNSIKILKFNILYFTSENDIWVNHLFKSLSKEQINKIIHKSIYKYESRLKMEISQDGFIDLTLYKCAKCQIIIDPSLLYTHAESICTPRKNYPCSFCGLSFISNELQVQHEQNHKRANVTLKSYRIVIFNREEDKTYNSVIFSRNYVFYQCRNCENAVDKSMLKNHECNINNLVKCSYCGLLFHVRDYELHYSKHKTLACFTADNMKVILFGEKTGKQMIHDNNIKSTFSGNIYDYTFYRCKNCNICDKNAEFIRKHKCDVEINGVLCRECDLHFFIYNLKLHQELHKINPDFIKENIEIITFDSSKYNAVIKNVEDHITTDIDTNNAKRVKKTQSVFKDATQNNNFEKSQNIYANESSKNGDNIVEKDTTIYKCSCGLHFLKESDASGHIKICGTKIRIHRQTCSKCDMVFTPNALFNHLLTHHASTKDAYKFNIIEVSKEQAFAETVYKCIKCTLHFSRNEDAKEHVNVCPSNRKEGIKCKICGLLFDSSSIASHEMDHKNGVEVYEALHSDLTQQNENNTSNEILEDNEVIRSRSYNISREKLLKVDLNKYDNTIYKCIKCNIHYLTKETIRKHVRYEKHTFVKYEKACNICGLNFPLPSLAKHKYVHHEQLNLKSTDIVVTECYSSHSSTAEHEQ